MPTISESWKQCQAVFGGTKYAGLMNPDGAKMVSGTPAQMRTAGEQYGEIMKLPYFCEVYLDGWGFRMIAAEWITVGGKPVVNPSELLAKPVRKAPPPPPGKRKAPPPPPRRIA